MTRERLRHGLPGIPMLFVAFAAFAGIVWLFVSGGRRADEAGDPTRLFLAIGLIPF